jgi:hypothetical protein
MRTNEQITRVIEGAFRPLRCVAEIWDYEKKLRFRVFDANDQPVVTFPEQLIASLSSDAQLSELISQARDRVQSKGHSLDAWKLPTE